MQTQRRPAIALRAIVIGAGPAGLTAARALLDAGASEVQVFERRSEEDLLGGAAGLGIQVNAMAALLLLSGSQEGKTLAHDVAAIGIYDPVGVFCTHRGRVLKRLPNDTDQAPPGLPGMPPPVGSYNVSVTRRNLQRTLYAALPPGTVTCGKALSSLRHLEDGRVEACFTDGSIEVCDLLIGADGVRSAVRACLDEQAGGPRREPVYSGYLYCRGLVDLANLEGGAEGWSRAIGGGGATLAMFYGVNGTCVTYQVTPEQASIGRYHRAPEGAPRGLTPQQTKQQLQKLCEGWASPAPEMAATMDPSAVHLGELWSLPPRKEGSWGSGCVTLVGDSCHALLPMLGQGACQGIEDAVELGVALHRAAAAELSRGGSGAGEPAASSAPAVRLSASEVGAALRGFEASRGPRVARVYDVTMSLFRTGVGESWLGRLKRDLTFWLLPPSLMRSAGAWLTNKRFSWDG